LSIRYGKAKGQLANEQVVKSDDLKARHQPATYLLLSASYMHKRYIPLLWIILLLGYSPWSLAQHLSFRYLGSEQGLNTLASWSCVIDQHGFLWIGTSDGLVRFNGKQATYYFQQDHPEMPTDQVGYIFADSRNHIWVCSNKGLVRIDEQRQFKRQIVLQDQPAMDVDFCCEDGDGNMYAFSAAGTFLLRDGQPAWIAQPWLDSLIAGRGFKDLRQFDRDRYLLVFPSAGVMLVNMTERKQEVFVPAIGANCATRFDAESILIGKSGGFELLHVSLDQPSVLRKISPPPFFKQTNRHEQIHSLVRAADQHVYITTEGEGLISLDSSLTHYTHYTHDPLNPSTIIENSLRFILADSSGNLVVTCLGGVNYTNVHNTDVEYVNYLQTDDGEIIDQRVVGIAEDRFNKLWICTNDNVFVYDHDHHRTQRISIPATVKLKSNTLSPICVERDKDDRLWVALRQEGIAIFNPTGVFSKLISSADYPEFGKPIDKTRIIREGNDGYVYIGTEDGLFRMSRKDFKLDTFADHPDMAPLRRARIVDILPVENGIWVTSSPGGAAWHYSFTDRKLRFFNQQNGLMTNRIYGIAAGKQGNMYVGSYSGFSIISPTDSIRNFIKGQGLISPRVESIEVAEDGSVWMTNNYSLLKYNPATGDMLKVGGRQGLTNVNFAVMSSVRLASGKIAFGANKGLIIVDPSIIKFGTDSLKVYVFYRDAEGREIEVLPGKKLDFNYKQQNIRFSFAVNDIMVADQILFRYQLSKKNQTAWSSPSELSSVDFNLDPGAYRMQVEAFDGYRWYAFPDVIQLRISPPWWKEWWVISFALLISVTGFWFYFRGRIEKYKKELSIARQISDLESKALRAQMNPHFVFNSLNAIQECIVTGKIEEAYTYLSQFSRLLRLVLEHSDVGEISLHEELEVLSLFVSLEQLRFRNEMEFVMDVEEALDKDEIMIPPMLIQPHLENAIWHGLRNKDGKKLLKLTIHEHIPDYLEVVIEDNGIGRIRAQELRQGRLGGSTHTSKGKQLSGNRMELLKSNHALTNMTITDLVGEDGTPIGTRVQLVIPIIGK